MAVNHLHLGSNGVTRSAWPTLILLVASILLPLSAVSGADKVIRLRNETIITPQASPPPPGAVGLAANEPAMTGLYVLQFSDRFQSEWRVALKAAGVELLKYVPEDAFIARFKNVSAQQLRTFPFLHWFGNYRPDHNRHIYADQRYYLALDDYGTQFGLPANYAGVAWRDGLPKEMLI